MYFMTPPESIKGTFLASVIIIALLVIVVTFIAQAF